MKLPPDRVACETAKSSLLDKQNMYSQLALDRCLISCPELKTEKRPQQLTFVLCPAATSVVINLIDAESCKDICFRQIKLVMVT